MLDEKEYEEVDGLYRAAMRPIKGVREREGVSLQHPSISERFQPVRDHYERLTGMKESNENAIMHHRFPFTVRRVGTVESRFAHPKRGCAQVA